MPEDLGFGSWKTPHLTWTVYQHPIVNEHPELSSNAWNNYVHDSMIKALGIWSRVIPIEFSENTEGVAQIKVSFHSLTHNDKFPFDGPGGELAHTFYPNEVKKGEIHIDDDEPWGPDGGRNLEWTLAHELGHLLGIPHLPAPSLMQEGYRGYLNSPMLTAVDLKAIETLFNLK